MNTKALELQAKALAPVIRSAVTAQVAAVKTQLEEHHAEQVAGLMAQFNDRLDGLKTAVEALEKQENPDFEAVKGLISEQLDGFREENEARGAEEKADIEHHFTQLYDDMDRHKEATSVGFEAVRLELDTLQKSGTPDENAIKGLISAQIEQFKADFPAPEAGKDGDNGKDGAPGRDAVDLEILPAIDPEKSYPRGTYALHNGGLVRAYQQTTGEKGWDVVQNGIADLEIDQNNDREFTLKAIMTDGRAVEQRFELPVAIYRNTYRDDGDYRKGDFVQHGGSIWHADKSRPPGKPGTGKPEETGWSLAVKKGRDGKSYTRPELKALLADIRREQEGGD